VTAQEFTPEQQLSGNHGNVLCMACVLACVALWHCCHTASNGISTHQEWWGLSSRCASSNWMNQTILWYGNNGRSNKLTALMN